ncbi:hypothetical protein KAU04_06690 [bacterium]|nr:hypothetical protein [bacterium]
MEDIRHGGEKGESCNCAIIGDIKGSRELDDWEHLFGELKRVLEETNERFSDVIIVRFTPTVGDEFQGAIKTPERAIELLNFMRSKLPVDIYCGLGVGAIEKLLDEEVGMRGSAFYRARDVLEVCKKKKRNIIIKSSSTPNPTDDMINELLRFIELLENSWTERQRALVSYYRLHPNFTYEQLGKHFGYTRQAAYQFLIGAHWELVMAGNNLVNKLLKSYLKK